MVGLVLKGGFLFVVVMLLLSSTRTEPAPDMIAGFLANGVIPGTNFIIPPEVMLITVALAFMIIAATVSRLYAKQQAKMRALIPNYDDYEHDPPLTALIPGLGRLLHAYYAMRLRTGLAMTGYWTQHVARRASVRAAAGRNVVYVLMRPDRWAPVRIRVRIVRPRSLMKAGAAMLRSLRFRLQAYLLRVTML
jgi:hypothetical protein